MRTKKLKVLDIIFILLLIVFVVVVFRQKTVQRNDARVSNAVLVLQTDEIEEASTKAIKEGDTCVDKRRNNVIGTVKSFEVGDVIDNPIGEYSGTDDGRTQSDSFKSLRMNIATEAKVKDDGIYINGTQYLLGEDLTFTVGDLQVYAKLNNIEVSHEK